MPVMVKSTRNGGSPNMTVRNEEYTMARRRLTAFRADAMKAAPPPSTYTHAHTLNTRSSIFARHFSLESTGRTAHS